MTGLENICPCAGSEEQLGDPGHGGRGGGMKRCMKKKSLRTGKIEDYFFFLECMFDFLKNVFIY